MNKQMIIQMIEKTLGLYLPPHAEEFVSRVCEVHEEYLELSLRKREAEVDGNGTLQLELNESDCSLQSTYTCIISEVVRMRKGDEDEKE